MASVSHPLPGRLEERAGIGSRREVADRDDEAGSGGEVPEFFGGVAVAADHHGPFVGGDV